MKKIVSKLKENFPWHIFLVGTILFGHSYFYYAYDTVAGIVAMVCSIILLFHYYCLNKYLNKEMATDLKER